MTKILHLIKSLKLRTQLLLMALLLSIPSIALIIYTGIEQKQEGLKEGLADGKRLLNAIALEQYNLTGSIEQMLEVLAQLPEVRNKNAAATNAILANVHRINPEYGNIIATDRSGNIWASALASTKPVNLIHVRSIRNALETRRFASGEYNIGRISGKHTLGFAYPFYNARGEVDGVVSANFNFDKINTIFNKAEFPNGSSYTISDHRGIIIDRNLSPNEFVGKQDDKALFQRIKEGPEEDSFFGYGLRKGEKQIISYRKLKLADESAPYLYIRISIPLKETLTKAHNNQIRNAALLLPFLLAVIILTLKMGKYCFVEPIDRLQVAAQRMAHGDLDVSVSGFSDGGELGRLGQAFDNMAKQLAERALALHDSEREYRFLAENSADIIWRLDPDRSITYINPADEILRGYAKYEVLGKKLTDLMPPDDAMYLDELNKKRQEQEQDGIVTGLIRFEASMYCKNGGTICVEVLSSPIRDEHGEIVGSHGVARDISERKKYAEEREKLIAELQDALAEIKTLSGILPICSYCKKIRNDEGYWNQLESFISKHTEAQFSHGICPDCAKTALEEFEQFKKQNK